MNDFLEILIKYPFKFEEKFYEDNVGIIVKRTPFKRC
jgi:hypothetical protein